MNKVRPRNLIHRGFVDASGYLFNLNLCSETEARLRILSRWLPGARVFRLQDSLVLRLPKKQPVYCDQALGLPLTTASGTGGDAGQALLGTELADDELKSLNPPSLVAVYVRDGSAIVCQLDKEEDPSSWIDVRSFKTVPVQTLAASAAVEPQPAIVPDKFEPRQQLNVPPAAAELAQVMQKLREQNAARAGGFGGLHGRRGVAALPGLLARLFALIKSRSASGSTASSSSSTMARHTTPFARAPQLPAWMLKLNKSMMDLLRSIGVLGFFETEQAKYVVKMMDMFERGDFSDALKHAIPLGGEAGESLRSLGVPTIRHSFDISLGQQHAGSSIHMPNDYYSRLRDLYRSAYNSLSNAGKIDEAAFVLIELLQLPEEGVAYLERHKRFKLAAQLAEARNLPAPLVVRLWFLAGDSERAVTIARLRNAFSEAVILLDKNEPEQAQALRIHWVHYLAESGNFVMAARIAQEQLKMTGLARAWVKKALEAGHASSGQLLALIWRSFRSEFPELRSQIQELLDDDSREHADARVAFVKDLLTDSMREPDTLLISRVASRALLRDVGSGYVSFSKKQFGNLTSFSKDAVFWVDMQAAQFPPPPRSLVDCSSPINIVVKAGDIGSAILYDAVLLPNGRALVALGEAGVYLISQDGKVIKHFHAPADQFIESDNGDRVLCIAARGQIKRMTRIDAITGKADDLGEVRFDRFAPSYNGSNWFASFEDQFMVMDATADRCKLLWLMPNVPGNVENISRDPWGCCFIVRWTVKPAGQQLFQQPAEPEKWERWQCDHPDLILRNRLPITSNWPRGVLLKRLTAPNGTVIEMVNQGTGDPESSAPLSISVFNPVIKSQPVAQLWTVPTNTKTAISNNWLAVVTGATCSLVSIVQMKVVAQIDLQSSAAVAARISDRHLILCDDLGRLFAIDLQNGQIVRSLRIM